MTGRRANIRMGVVGWQCVIVGSSGSVLGRGLGRNGHVAIGSQETLQGWLGMSVTVGRGQQCLQSSLPVSGPLREEVSVKIPLTQ